MSSEPSDLEKSMTSQQIMDLVTRVSVYLRCVFKSLHRDDCESEANIAVVEAVRRCNAPAGLAALAKTIAARGAMKIINRAKPFVTLDADGWREVDEATPVEHDAYADGDIDKFIADNFTPAEYEAILAKEAGYRKLMELTGIPERKARELCKRRKNDARTKTKLATQHEHRRRPAMPGLA